MPGPHPQKIRFNYCHKAWHLDFRCSEWFWSAAQAENPCCRITKSTGFIFYQKASFTNPSLSVISKLEIYRNKKESYPDTLSIYQNKMHQTLFIHPHQNLGKQLIQRCSPRWVFLCKQCHLVAKRRVTCSWPSRRTKLTRCGSNEQEQIFSTESFPLPRVL